MSRGLTDQARRLHGVFSELLRRYQFRDREQICCHGISVSQCYALELLESGGPLATGVLAGRLFLEISSLTRAVDGLVDAGLVSRVADPADRRVRLIKITAKGTALVRRIRDDIITAYAEVLRTIAADSREDVIAAVTRLLEGFERQCGTTDCCES